MGGDERGMNQSQDPTLTPRALFLPALLALGIAGAGGSACAGSSSFGIQSRISPP